MSGLCGLLVLAMENGSLYVPSNSSPVNASIKVVGADSCPLLFFHRVMLTPQSTVSDTAGSHQAQEDKEESHHGLLHHISQDVT